EAVYAFWRRDGQNRAVVVVNLTAQPQLVTLEVGDAAGAYTELFDARAAPLAVREVVSLEPWDYRLYVSGAPAQAERGAKP
ncbi:MAG: alpha-glucosidase C-terminal domain-containing protein, partial [Planctomycetota bacterium]|nr:alpha-glucosidase C-terminal domain-containing protein [Planctomycetota bacterium]